MKNKKKDKKVTTPKRNIQELIDSRAGGQIALKGYSYQLLYSCYLILTTVDSDASFQMEGVEDIDHISQKKGGMDILNIQLKYSKNKQDASFLKPVLKNFFEAYLLDKDRNFKLVYDFPVAKGHLSKLMESRLDAASRDYWRSVIDDIKLENPEWNWASYDFGEFLSALSFEKKEKFELTGEIENALIDIYDIDTDNLVLFANSIKVFCLEKMEQRACITRKEIDACIQTVKIDISKGACNPAHSWIRKINFHKVDSSHDDGFYEGKKATPTDIANGLPVRRPLLEQEIESSIEDNDITVIKTSSGQGKTTLALQTAYNLKEEYTTYQLLWCNDIKEIGNIVQYFKARIQVGEKVLIVLDNLDSHLQAWNQLVQQLQAELPCHYKILITSRETDWYNFSNDLSKIHSIKIIKPMLVEREAIEIFNMFQKMGRLHTGISSWKDAWNKIAKKRLLIEYIYLLTHGEMLSERITAQMSEIGKLPSGKAKYDILRKVCCADICGVKLSIKKLFVSQSDDFKEDIGELMKSMESEFLVQVSEERGYVEGLHPVRSRHIFDRLHEFLPIEDTLLSVIQITERTDLPMLFTHLPEFDLKKEEFAGNLVEILWDNMDFSKYIIALQGLFSGSVMQYYRANKTAFDDANNHGGLFVISTEVCPLTNFEEFDVSVDTLDKMKELFPDNENIEYLRRLGDGIPKCNFHETFLYYFCSSLYKNLYSTDFDDIKDIESYAFICELLYNIDVVFNLSVNIDLDQIWDKADNYSLDSISTLMYASFCGNRDVYTSFVETNIGRILTYLKHQTKAYKLYVSDRKVYVEYVLRMRDVNKANDESVSRLKYICKMLPIYDYYCADALKPQIRMLAAYKIPDDAHKEMPIRNLVIMFRQNLTSIWNKTIMSNYEFDTVSEWLDFWLDVRKRICILIDKYCECIYRILSKKKLGSLAGEVDQLHSEFCIMTTGEKGYPKANKPFGDREHIPEDFLKQKNRYIESIRNFSNQFVGFLNRDNDLTRVAMFNLTTAQSECVPMQHFFDGIVTESEFESRHIEISNLEVQYIKNLVMCCQYYETHIQDSYFTKYQIKEWYEDNCRMERESAEEGLMQLRTIYPVHFPNKTYTVGALSYYPIVIDCADDTLNTEFITALLGCVGFVHTNYDYLVVLLANEELKPTAIQFPKRMFVEIQKAIETNEDSVFETIHHPYPVDVSEQMLECFDERYVMPMNNSSYGEELSVGNIAEELWIYSLYQNALSECEDIEYLRGNLQETKKNIDEILSRVKNGLSANDVEWVTEACNIVFDGKIFDDDSFNEFIEKFIKVE